MMRLRAISDGRLPVATAARYPWSFGFDHLISDRNLDVFMIHSFISDVQDWCQSKFGETTWRVQQSAFHFKREREALEFKLRWC